MMNVHKPEHVAEVKILSPLPVRVTLPFYVENERCAFAMLITKRARKSIASTLPDAQELADNLALISRMKLQDGFA